MPILRSNTVRNKSRSPGPPRTPGSSTTPKFMPPSHYAAAGGYNTRETSPKTRKNNGEYAPTRSRSEKPAALDDCRRAPHTGSRKEDYIPDFHELKRRQSIRNGFPELEAQLLPTLRDTIDRMTGSPSRTSIYTIGNPTSETSKRDNWTQIYKNSPEQWTAYAASTPYKHRYRNEETTTPIPSQIYSDQSAPTPSGTSSRLRTPGKSALKSSLKSPMTKSSISDTPTLLDASPSVAGSSLKTMRSLLTRKCSSNLKSPFNSNRAQESTRKDPRDAHSHRQASSSPRQNEISRNGSPSRSSSRLHGLRMGFQSSIPRPRVKRHNNDSHDAYIEDSDLEHRFELESRDRRRLTVANAEILISGSESDVESWNPAITKTRESVFNKADYTRGGAHPVGLGLSLPPSQSGERLPWPSPEARKENIRPVALEKNLRFSLPPSESASSSYSEEMKNHCQPEEFSRSEVTHYISDDSSQRSANKPTPGCGRYSPAPSRALGRKPNRDSCGSTSSYFHRSPRSPVSFNDPEVTAKDEFDSERESYSLLQSRVCDKQRTSPAYVGLPKDKEGTHPHRFQPNSPRHRRTQESSLTDRAFPPTLSDLIKNRNSIKMTAQREELSPGTPSTLKHRYNYEPEKKRGRDSWKAEMTPVGSPVAHCIEQACRSNSREQTEAAAIAEGYRSAAVRERSVFGIPPSESDQALSGEDQMGHLSHTDSDMSSINESIWQAQEDASFDADSILKNVRSMPNQEQHDQLRRYDTATPRLSVISPTLSTSSVYDRHDIAPEPWRQWNHTQYQTKNSRWETTEEGLFPSYNNSVPHPNDELPKTREGVIQEIFESEEELLRLLHICMQAFILPLRIQDSRSWIEGVPPNVARLLDWFDDIVNLHEQIYQSLCSARDTMSPATDRVSESLRWFVLKVEVYQPYLVRLADVSQEIAALTEDAKSDFGQFIRLQEQSLESQGWTFEKLLMLPVNRLASYQDLFLNMLDLTPKTHQDYLSTFSLSRSTDMVIKVMTEVKFREDEYNLLKAFSSRIQGLPSTGLATRERRLLHSGPLQLVLSNLSDHIDMSGQDRTSEAKRISRSSRLLDAISKPQIDFEKADSLRSGSSSTTGKTGPSKSPATKSSWLSRLPLRKRSRSRNKSPSPPDAPHVEEDSGASDIALQAVDIHAFVFNDVVLLAQQTWNSGSEASWRLSDNIGIFRPLSIARIRRRNAQGMPIFLNDIFAVHCLPNGTAEGTILSLEAMVLTPENFNDESDFRTSSFQIVDLLIPSHPLGSSAEAMEPNSNDDFQFWLGSLRKCCKATLRKLTFVGPAHGSLDMTSDQVFDTHLVVASLVSSGLPVPRSPSGYFPETRSAPESNLHEKDKLSFGDEREERGWWSLRYQQVFRELQRQDSTLSEDEDEV